MTARGAGVDGRNSSARRRHSQHPRRRFSSFFRSRTPPDPPRPLKASGVAVADKSHRRVRGLAANAIVAAMSLAATNIRKIRAFHDNEHPLSMEPRPRPKPGDAWEDDVAGGNPFRRNTWDLPRQKEPPFIPAAA